MSNANSFTGCLDSIGDWLASLPPCRGCVDRGWTRGRKGGGDGPAYLSPEEIERLVNQSRTGSVVSYRKNGSVHSSKRRSPSSGFHELPGGHVSHGSIGGDSVSIIFDLATPETLNAGQSNVVRQPAPTGGRDQWDAAGTDYARGKRSEENAAVFQISGQSWNPSLLSEPPLDLDRGDLQFNLSYGKGWFGWIVQGSHRVTGEDVVVQILKEEATMEEEIGFREISRPSLSGAGHPNVLRLVGHCYEAVPRLQIYELCRLGDLKTFMVENRDRFAVFNSKGYVLRFCQGLTSGLAHLHRNDCVLSDLAARCCQLTEDMVVKIGDYGTATTSHLEDYVPVNGDNCPVRWIPPDMLRKLDEATSASTSSEDDSSFPAAPASASAVVWTKEANMWSLAVTLWEVLTFGERPFDEISDFRFVNEALQQPERLVKRIGKLRILDVAGEAVESVIDLCLRADPAKRPSCDRVDSYLTDFSDIIVAQQREREESANGSLRQEPSTPDDAYSVYSTYL